MGDVIADVSIAKSGFGEMALTGCIAGTVFNLMLGLGITTLICNMNKTKETGIVFQSGGNQSSLYLLYATTISLFILVCIAAGSGFKIKQWYSKILFIVYVIAIVLISYVTLT